MARVIIAHRWSGTPTTDWYPWLAAQLGVRGFEVIIPEMGDTEEPTIEEWVGNLSQAIGEPDKETIIVCHSIGTQATWRYLEQLEGKTIAGVVAVAPWFHLQGLEDEEVEAIARPWVETPIDDAKVRQVAGRIIAFFSDNDPYVALSEQELFEKRFGAQTTLKQASGHFTEDDGYTEFPEVLDAVLSLTKE